DLRAMYQFLSGGTDFDSPEEIERLQVQLHFGDWLEGKQGESQLVQSMVLHGRTDSWTDRMQIVVRSQMSHEMVESIRSERDSLHTGLRHAFEHWQRMEERPLEKLYEDEILAFGRGTLEAFARAAGRLAAASSGIDIPIAKLMPTTPTILVSGLLTEAER